MAVTTNVVKFVSGTWSQYTALQTKDENTVYMITDKGLVFKGSQQMTINTEVVNNKAALSSTMPLNRLYITKDDHKLYFYDSTLTTPAFVEVSPTEWLGDGDVGNGHTEINATYGSASANKVVSEKQVSKFVADQIALISSSVGSIMGAPVQDLTALAALDSDDLTDKEIRLVEDDNAIWRYDAESTETPTASNSTPKTVVKPTDVSSGAGRWIKLLNGASLFITNTAPEAVGFVDSNSDNVYEAKAAAVGTSGEVARADHVHALVGVARADQICWQTLA